MDVAKEQHVLESIFTPALVPAPAFESLEIFEGSVELSEPAATFLADTKKFARRLNR